MTVHIIISSHSAFFQQRHTTVIESVFKINFNYKMTHEYIFPFKSRIFIDKTIVLSDLHPKFNPSPPSPEIITGELSLFLPDTLKLFFTHINRYTEKIFYTYYAFLY